MRISQRAKGIAVIAGSVLFLITIALELAFGISGLFEYHPQLHQFQNSYLDVWVEFELLFSTIIAAGIIASGIMMILSYFIVESVQNIPTGLRFSILLGMITGFGLIMYSYYVITQIPVRVLPIWKESGEIMDVVVWTSDVTSGILSISRFDFGLGAVFCCALGCVPLAHYLMMKNPSGVDLGFQLLLILLPLPFMVSLLELFILGYTIYFTIFGHLGVILAEAGVLILLVWFAYRGTMMKDSATMFQQEESIRNFHTFDKF